MTKNWFRDIIGIPLLIAVGVAILTFFLPSILGGDKAELSYAIDAPIPYPPLAGMQVDGIPTSQLFAYKIRIWNSGKRPLKQVPVRLELQPSNPTVKIFSATHTTKPASEFGAIKEETPSSSSRRFLYDLLNPGDEDLVVLPSNTKASMQLYAKVEGMAVKEVHADEREATMYSSSVAGILVSAIFGVLVTAFQARRQWLSWLKHTPSP
jgi:hypothetical protein